MLFYVISPVKGRHLERSHLSACYRVNIIEKTLKHFKMTAGEERNSGFPPEKLSVLRFPISMENWRDGNAKTHKIH